MLILSRNKGQKIMINDNIVISILEINGDQVRIGIEAPADVSIYREEIYAAIQKQNKDAVEFTSDVQNILNILVESKKK